MQPYIFIKFLFCGQYSSCRKKVMWTTKPLLINIHWLKLINHSQDHTKRKYIPYLAALVEIFQSLGMDPNEKNLRFFSLGVGSNMSMGYNVVIYGNILSMLAPICFFWCYSIWDYVKLPYLYENNIKACPQPSGRLLLTKQWCKQHLLMT